MRAPKRGTAGFTLVEILVVLAIVGVLAALILTVFARVRERGRSATCQGNLHQIGLAMQQYVSDNSGFYPDAYGESNAGVKWSDMLQPYLKSTQTFDCPSHTVTDRWVPHPGSAYSPEFSGDYEYAWWLLDAYTDTGRVGQHIKTDPISQARSEMRMTNPAETPIVLDAGWIDYPDNILRYLSDDGSTRTFYHTAHSGGANFCFADGHVKWLSLQQQAAVRIGAIGRPETEEIPH